MLTPDARGFIFVLAVILASGQIGCGQKPLFNRQEKFAVPQVAGTELTVATTNGTISVNRSSGGDVQIVATIRAETEARAKATQIVAERRIDHTLAVRVDWPNHRAHGREGCDFEIAVPDTSGVTLITDNGRLRMTGSTGAASLETINGSIEVARHAGPIIATTTNGEVAISGATESVKAKATNGAVQVSLAPDSPGPVELQTTNGAVELNVGPAFVGKLSLETTVGRINVDSPITARRIESGPNHFDLEFGTSEQKSFATSVAGQIRVGTITGPAAPK